MAVLSNRDPYHLSRSYITIATQAIYPSTTDEKPLNADILDISPHRNIK
jgi:hypothetical protein